jgi:ribosomal peptide maturation radical SAM protein 1
MARMDSRVLLVSMPWQSASTPSIQLGILKSALESAHIGVDSLYANLTFANAIGFEEYAKLAAGDWYPFVCEWLFNGFMDPSDGIQDETLMTLMDVFGSNPIAKLAQLKDQYGNILDPRVAARRSMLLNEVELSTRDYFHRIKYSIVPTFYDTLFSECDFGAYTLVGLSCAFSQLVPSLSLAHEIKRRFPKCRTALGGSAVQGPIGAHILKLFPQIDYVCDADGEGAIVAMANGVFVNGSQRSQYDVGQSPLPSYDDYFTQLDRFESGRIGSTRIHDGSIPYESSRGCLIAAKQPCAFCALNGSQPSSSCKSVDSIISDIEELTRRYSPKGITFTDNFVNVQSNRVLFEWLRQREQGTTFFLETTPTLTRPDLALLSGAGVVGIQAGVEALSTSLLGLLGKRNSLSRTLQFLEDCSDLGIAVHYNLLIGIPGESRADYRSVLDLIPSITHLPPPAIPLTPISLQRYSPYWRAPERYGIRNVRPARQYSMIYQHHMIGGLSFFYDFDVEMPPTVDYLNELVDSVLEWRTHYYRHERSTAIEPQ